MGYQIKEYVSIFMTPEVSRIIHVVDTVLHGYGEHAFITSGNDGKHSKRSKHYRNGAVDFRKIGWEESIDEVVGRVSRNLGDDYDVVMERTHLHVEYDPK